MARVDVDEEMLAEAMEKHPDPDATPGEALAQAVDLYLVVRNTAEMFPDTDVSDPLVDAEADDA